VLVSSTKAEELLAVDNLTNIAKTASPPGQTSLARLPGESIVAYEDRLAQPAATRAPAASSMSADVARHGVAWARETELVYGDVHAKLVGVHSFSIDDDGSRDYITGRSSLRTRSLPL
jgi:hypothetical protein